LQRADHLLCAYSAIWRKPHRMGGVAGWTLLADAGSFGEVTITPQLPGSPAPEAITRATPTGLD
jgi:hypothetical protein